MALHYHGLPLTPLATLYETFNGQNVCISYATARETNIDWALKHAQSVMWDNGAFSYYQKNGNDMDPNAFYAWLEGKLGHPHWAVVPDVIGGDVEKQREFLKTWPFRKELGAPVWHLGLDLDYLLELADEWPKVCLGSSAEYWQVGSPLWEARMDDAFDYLSSRRTSLPWLHGLRMLGQLHKRWPLSSADSVNVSRNYKSAGKCPGCMANRINAVNPPLTWREPQQIDIQEFEMAKTIVEIDAQIANLQKKRAEMAAAEKAQGFIDNLKAGDVIQFVFGRKDNRKTYGGEVRSVIDTDKGKFIRVIKGDGAEEEIVSIRPGDIVGVGEEAQEAEARGEAQAVVFQEVYGGGASAEAANGDPLANLI